MITPFWSQNFDELLLMMCKLLKNEFNGKNMGLSKKSLIKFSTKWENFWPHFCGNTFLIGFSKYFLNREEKLMITLFDQAESQTSQKLVFIAKIVDFKTKLYLNRYEN